MAAPCAAVPLPGGNPAPSGMTLMSHAAVSAAVSGLPRRGPSAAQAEPAHTASAHAQATSLCIDMPDLPAAVDRPARDGVAMLVGKREHRRRRLQLAAVRDEFRAQRLRVPRLVPRAA